MSVRNYASAVTATLLASVLLCNILNVAQATTYTFTQNNWTGGATSNTALHPGNENGWTQYQSSTGIAVSSTIQLGTTSASIYQTSNTDFNAGTFASTTVTGSGAAASVVLATGSSVVTTTSYAYTGATSTFIVPGGVTSITIHAVGAGGGISGSFNAGSGGSSTGTLSVTPGATYYFVVGGTGASGSNTEAGGFGGGGTGYYGGGGGGMTWFGAANIFGTTTSTSQVIIVAGGGGGGSSCPGGTGGGSSGSTASMTGCTSDSGGTGAGGGTQSAGGVGAYANYTQYSGASGTFGHGGNGWYVNATNFGGAGGGGGYFGGGGGSTDQYAWNTGGGGGSGFVSSTLSAATTTQGTGAPYQTNGSLSISYSQVTYVSSGTFTSAPLNASNQNWNTISWDNSGGQTITMKARSANNASMTGALPWTSCSAIVSGGSLTGGGCVNNGDAYIQYQATLSTSNNAQSPSLDDVTIAYTGVSTSGNLVSSPYDSGSSGNAIGSLAWTEGAIPASTTATISLRTASTSALLVSSPWTNLTDNTANCTNVSGTVTCSNAALPSSMQSGSANEWFQYEVALTTSNASTPTISSVVVQYVVNSPPQFNPAIGGGTGVAASELNGTSSSAGWVQFQFSALDSDANTDGSYGGHATSTVTPSYQYSLNGGATWNPMNTFITPNATSDITMATGTWSPTSTIIWNAKADVGSQYVTNAEISVTLNDHQPANNTATATSAAFALDTQAPVVNSLTMDASAQTISFNFSDNSNFYYRVSGSPFTTSTPTSSLPFVNVGGTATTTSGFPLVFASTSTPVVYTELEDVYGNDLYQISNGPVVPTGFAVKDVSNKQAGKYQAYLSWSTSTIPNFKQYDVFRSTGGSFSSIATVTPSSTTSYVDTGLSSTTVYYYKIRVEDTNGNISAFTPQVFITPTGNGGGPAISSVASNPSDTSAVVTWNTNILPQASYVYWSLSPVMAAPVSIVAAVATSGPPFVNTATLTNLVPADTYYFYVQSTDAQGDTTIDNNNGLYYSFQATNSHPPVISNIQLTPSQNSADIRWQTDKPTNSAVYYGTAAGSETNSVSSTMSLTTTPEVLLNNLQASTTYYYYLYSSDSLNHVATTSESYFVTSQFGPVISGVTTTKIGSTSATITWSTSKVANSNVYYSTSTNASSFTGIQLSDASTTHAVPITGLAPLATYYYYVQAVDSYGNVTTDKNGGAYYSFTTAADTVPPVISNITTPTLGQTVATVAWNTDKAATSRVLYGTTSGVYTASTTLDPTLVTSHAVSLTGLAAATKYYFVAASVDQYGNSATSTEQSFTTLTLPGPEITAVEAVNTNDFGATITWTTDTNSDSHVYYSTATSSFTFSSGSSNFVGGSAPYAHSVTIANLAPGTTYYFYVQSTDLNNNTTINKNGGAYYAFATTNTANPTVTDIQATSITSSSALIGWTTDKQANSQVLYGLTSGNYASSTSVYDNAPRVTNHNVALSGLAPDTIYYYVVTSVDSAGNTAQSSENSFTTVAPAGPQISSVTVASASDYNATITWTTNTDSDSHVYYANSTSSFSLSSGSGNLVGGVAPYEHSVTVTNLTPSTTYYFYVQSVDAYNNASIDKNDGAYYSFVSTNVAQPVLSNVSVVVQDQYSAGITWSTDKLSNSQVFYGTSTGMYTASTSITDLGLVTSPHSLAITGLVPATTYYFMAQSVDAGGNVGTSSEHTFRTLSLLGPTITNVSTTPFDVTANVSWDTDVDADSFVFYGTSTQALASSTGSSLFIGGSAPFYHEVTLSGLAPQTTYYFYVQSTDASGNIASTQANGLQAFTTSAPVFSNVTSTYIGDTEAIINWQTTMDSDSFVEYFQPLGSGSSIVGVGTSTLVGGSAPFQHSVEIDGLNPGTTYDYYLESDDASGNVHVDNNFNTYYTFTTTDHRPPAISDVSVPIVNASSAIIVWSTDRPATSQVNYGLASGVYTSSTDQDPTLSEYHAVTISGLAASTTYYFQAVSDSSVGSEGISGDDSFSTLSTGENEVIYVGSGEPAPVTRTTPPQISEITATTTPFNAIVNFVTDEPALGFVEYGSSTDYTSASADGAFNKIHSITIQGLIMGTTYHFDVKAIDQFGNTATSSDMTFTTQYLTEATLPASTTFANAYEFQQEIENSIASALPSLVPPFLGTPIVSDIGENGATVTWTTNIKSYSVVYYATDVDYNATSSNGNPYTAQTSDVNNKSTDHSIALTGLAPNTLYHIMAESFSLPGVFGKSADITFTTAAAKVVPQISNITPTGFQVSWTTDPLTNSIVEYTDSKTGLTQTITDDSLVTVHSVTVQNLTPGTNYAVNVSGDTAGGNVVAAASPIAVKTTRDTTPPVISNIKIQTIIDPQTPTVAQAIVGWDTDKPANSVINYDQGVGGVTSTFSHSIQDLTSFVTAHVVIIPNLAPGSVYRVQIVSTDEASNTTSYPPQTIIVSQQSQSILDVILNNFENTFQFLQNIQK